MPSVDGTVTLRIPNDDPLAAYRVVLAPDDGADSAAFPPPLTVPAEAATGEHLVWRRRDDDWQQYAGTGRIGISGTPHPGSTVTFPVSVPRGGEFTLGVLYGTDGVVARVEVLIDDGEARTVELPATLTRGFIGRATVPVRLDAGEHRVAVRPLDGTDITLDRIELDAGPAVARYDAPTALRSAGAQLNRSGAVTLAAGEGVAFYVGVPERGRYRLTLDGEPGTRMRIDGLVIGAPAEVALPAGISEIVIEAEHRTDVRALVVEALGAGAPVCPATDEAWTLLGAAELATAATGAFIDQLGVGEHGEGGAALPAPSPGRYLLTIAYSNADRRSGHEYNADVVDRFLSVRCDDGPAISLTFPFTNDWANFRTESFPIDVPPGASIIVLGAAGGPGPRVSGAALDIVA